MVHLTIAQRAGLACSAALSAALLYAVIQPGSLTILSGDKIGKTGKIAPGDAALLAYIGQEVPRPGSPLPGFSSYTCTGPTWSETPGQQVCRFDHVCLNRSSLQVQYHVAPEHSGLPLFYDHSAQPHFGFPPDFVSTGHSGIEPSVMPWAPAVVHAAIPAGAAYAQAPVAALASLNDYAFNFGHALFDFLFPVFNGLQLLRSYTPHFQLLLAQHQGQTPMVAGIFIRPSNPQRSLLRLISRREALTLPEAAAQQDLESMAGSDLTCFRALVVGLAHMQLGQAPLRALPFRTAAAVNIGLSSSSSAAPASLQRRPRVRLLRKQGRRTIENIIDVASVLRANLPAADVAVLEGGALIAMSIEGQARMREMAATDILITPCGGLGTVLVLLPPGATAIVMNYWNSARNTSTQMEAAYYAGVEYLDLRYFPVLPEDYAGTSDRPQCEKPRNATYFDQQGAFISCNLRIADHARLLNVVWAALLRWEARSVAARG